MKGADRELKARAAQALVDAGWRQVDALQAVGYRPGAAASLGVVSPDLTAQRNARMAEMYREGKTLEEIGLHFDVTRERVRQCLKKLGLSKNNGGAFVRKGNRDISRRERARGRRNARAMRLFGVDWETAVRLNNDSSAFFVSRNPARSYLQHKRNAGVRNIPWEMTFGDWMRIWQESGKWLLRGRGKGHYCMSRKGDAGAYSPDNVHVVTNDENIAEGWIVTPASKRFGAPMARRADRQRRALQLRSEGKTHKQIAAELGVSPHTSLHYCVNAKRLPA